MFSMKICRKCYVLNDNNSEKCWNCGAALHDAPPYLPVVVYPNPHRASEREAVLLFTSVTVIILIFLIPVILGGFVTSGQVYQYDTEPNNTFSFATNVSLRDSSLKGFVNQYTDHEDFYRFSFSRPVTNLNFTLVFEDRNLFNITVYDANTHLLNPIRNSTSSEHMLVERANLEMNGSMGDIYVRIAAERGGGEYALHFKVNPDQGVYSSWDSVSGAEVSGEGKSFSSAIPVYESGNYQAKLDSVTSPVQIYSIPMKAGEFFQCNISKFVNTDLNVSLYDSGKNLMISSFFLNDRSELVFSIQQDDTYYLVIRDLRGKGTIFLDISISHNSMYDGNNDIKDAEAITEMFVNGEVKQVYDDTDYLKVFLTKGEAKSVEVKPLSPLYLSLMDDEGKILKNDRMDDRTDFYIDANETGYYYMRIIPEGYSSSYSIVIVQARSGISDYIWIDNENAFSPVYAGDNISLRAMLPPVNGTAVNITWLFGDGRPMETRTEVSHTFSTAGNYTITATRSDNGEIDTYSIRVRQHIKEAIVIGISDYIESSVNDLNYCHRDALDWEMYLKPRGYNVTLLLNASAKKDSINSAIQEVEKRTGAGDTVLFIFSGHGFKMGDREFIAPADTLSFSSSNDISDLLLRSMFLTFRSEKRLVFLDSCYSGGMSEVADSSTLFISATNASELSIDSSAYANGLWTYYFLKVGLIKDNHTALEDAFYAVAVAYTLDAERNYETSSHPVIIDGNHAVPFLI